MRVACGGWRDDRYVVSLECLCVGYFYIYIDNWFVRFVRNISMAFMIFKYRKRGNMDIVIGWRDCGGAPGRIRTRGPLLRRQLLYPTELQGRGASAPIN